MIWFRRLISINALEGVDPQAIIDYRQKPWVQSPPYYFSMRCLLIIDLWIIVLRFDWDKNGKWDMAKWGHQERKRHKPKSPVYNRNRIWKRIKQKLNIFRRN